MSKNHGGFIDDFYEDHPKLREFFDFDKDGELDLAETMVMDDKFKTLFFDDAPQEKTDQKEDSYDFRAAKETSYGSEYDSTRDSYFGSDNYGFDDYDFCDTDDETCLDCAFCSSSSKTSMRSYACSIFAYLQFKHEGIPDSFLNDGLTCDYFTQKAERSGRVSCEDCAHWRGYDQTTPREAGCSQWHKVDRLNNSLDRYYLDSGSPSAGELCPYFLYRKSS